MFHFRPLILLTSSSSFLLPNVLYLICLTSYDWNNERTVRPVIEPFIMPHSVQMGQRLSITCTVIKGDPPINIKWMKDEIPLNEDSASSSSSSAINQNSFNSIASQSIRIHHLADYSSTLLFESVKPGDRGNYTCVASNNVGQDVHTAQMVIYGEWNELVTLPH